MGTQLTLPQRGTAPQFSAHLYCGQTAGCIKLSLGMEVGLGPGDFVLDGTPLTPPQKGGGTPKFLADVYCGQTAGWIKMVLVVEIGLSPGDLVLNGDPARPLNFRPMFIIVIVISLEHCTMHSRYWFVQVHVLVFYAFYFSKKKFNRTQSVPV